MGLVRIAACCLLLVALFACAADRRVEKASAEGPALGDLAGRTYYLVSMDGKIFLGDNTPELGFTSEGRMTARVCNRFNGTAKITNGTLLVENAVSTRMACFQPFLNEAEQMFTDMLRHGARISLAGNRLTLTRDGRSLVYELPAPKT